jgi:hypothetical protein
MCSMILHIVRQRILPNRLYPPVVTYDIMKRYFVNNPLEFSVNIYQKTKIKTKEHNNRQNFNICIRHLGPNKER